MTKRNGLTILYIKQELLKNIESKNLINNFSAQIIRKVFLIFFFFFKKGKDKGLIYFV